MHGNNFIIYYFSIVYNRFINIKNCNFAVQRGKANDTMQNRVRVDKNWYSYVREYSRNHYSRVFLQ